MNPRSSPLRRRGPADTVGGSDTRSPTHLVHRIPLSGSMLLPTLQPGQHGERGRYACRGSVIVNRPPGEAPERVYCNVTSTRSKRQATAVCPGRAAIRHHFDIKSFGVSAVDVHVRRADRQLRSSSGMVDDGATEAARMSPTSSIPGVQARAGRRVADGRRGPSRTLFPASKRTAFAEEPETTVIALGGTPGSAFDGRLGGLEAVQDL